VNENPLTAMLRPHVEAIKLSAFTGNARAREIINLYRLYLACPSDRAAAALCEATFKDWQRETSRERVG
jgi:uroporphyrinogen-III synthase